MLVYDVDEFHVLSAFNYSFHNSDSPILTWIFLVMFKL